MYINVCNSRAMPIKPKEMVGQCTPIRTCIFSISAPSIYVYTHMTYAKVIRTCLNMAFV